MRISAPSVLNTVRFAAKPKAQPQEKEQIANKPAQYPKGAPNAA